MEINKEESKPVSEIPGSVDTNGHPHLVRVKTPEARGDNDVAYTECPFADYGCTVTGEAIQIRRHIRDGSVQHLTMMCKTVKDLSKETEKSLEQSTKLYEESEVTVRKINEIGSLYRDTIKILSSFSSQYIWRIDGYKESFLEARRGRRSIIYSPPFYSHRQGYKLAAAIALYGDGDAIGEYNSVFLTILRGDNDAILPWPFKCPITFTLVNLKSGKDVEATVTPRITENNMPFLGRPRSDRNPAFGIKTFTDLRLMSEETNFVVNNTCFLKVDIDLEPIHKVIG
ncbi:unnamed protein product [Enterobius vermicularis]|uniref:MATH domain-containing protein n=1 Tax=Enterobius vermicularis TaxID=51028 RepID=A0A0N4VJ00_ENTVE|nr:unnamed protein product [Enterobius vermicularis]